MYHLERVRETRFELISARFALPEMPDPVSVQVLGPFRQEDCFSALGAVIHQPGLNELSGARGSELHGGVLPTMTPLPLCGMLTQLALR